MSVDPLLTSTHSAYAYVAGNPLNYSDPLGLSPVANFGVGVANGFIWDGLGTWISEEIFSYTPDLCSTAAMWGTGAGLVAGAIFPPGAGPAKTGVKAGIKATSGLTQAAEKGLQATATVASSGKRFDQTVYRGIAYGHPGYDNALKGIAEPRGGTNNLASHTGGQTNSPYTSWTTDRMVAQDFAMNGNGVGEGNGPGIVLSYDLKNVDDFRIFDSSLYEENELTILGSIFDAKVIKHEEFSKW